jgi:hypothetical protein
MAPALPRATLREIAAHGHFPQLSVPEVVNAAIRAVSGRGAHARIPEIVNHPHASTAILMSHHVRYKAGSIVLGQSVFLPDALIAATAIAQDDCYRELSS